MDPGTPSFGHNDPPTALPITTPETGGSAAAQPVPGPLAQTQALCADDFHLVDQNGQPVQYELQSSGDSNAQMVSTSNEITTFMLFLAKHILAFVDNLNFLTSVIALIIGFQCVENIVSMTFT